jgi:hypothetical protein
MRPYHIHVEPLSNSHCRIHLSTSSCLFKSRGSLVDFLFFVSLVQNYIRFAYTLVSHKVLERSSKPGTANKLQSVILSTWPRNKWQDYAKAFLNHLDSFQIEGVAFSHEEVDDVNFILFTVLQNGGH